MVSFAILIIIILSKEITKISDNVVKNQKLANMLTERTTLLEKLKQDVNIIGTNDMLINNAFIPSNNIIEFISALDSISLKNSITQAFHFSSPVESTISSPFPISTIDYNNSLSSNLPTFIRYTKDLEKLPYFTKINSLNITSQDATGIQGNSPISFQATLYTKTTQ